jgi:hypothetical protein
MGQFLFQARAAASSGPPPCGGTQKKHMPAQTITRVTRFVFAICWLPCWCMAANFPSYPIRPASEYPIAVAKAGLIVAAEPVENAKEQKTYFHTELAPKGYLPVLIVIQNETADTTFLLRRSDITYGSAEKPESGRSEPQARSKAGEALALVSLGALSPLGGLIAMKLITNSTQVQQNILKKELQSSTLSPGTSLHGFLYIPVPKNAPREKIHLIIPVARVGDDQTLTMDLIF